MPNPKLSTSMYVKSVQVIMDVECTLCTFKFTHTYDTVSMKLTGKLENIKLVTPDCPKCNNNSLAILNVY